MIKIILASKSPRRKEILEKKGYQIEVVDSLFNEDKTRVCLINFIFLNFKELYYIYYI